MWGRLCLIHPPPSLASATPWKKGEIHTAVECVKASFSIFSNISAFNVCCSTHATLRVWAKRGKFREKNVSESSHSNAKIFHFRSIHFPRVIIFERVGSFFTSSGIFQSPLDFYPDEIVIVVLMSWRQWHRNCNDCHHHRISVSQRWAVCLVVSSVPMGKDFDRRAE